MVAGPLLFQGRDIANVPDEEMRRLRIADFSSNVYPYTEDEGMRRIEQAKAGGPVRFEWHRRSRDGSLHWDEVCLKPAVIAGERRVLAFTRENVPEIDVKGGRVMIAVPEEVEARKSVE